jgi:hypothetical protein
MPEEERRELLDSFQGWLTIQQIENIKAAIMFGKFDLQEYHSQPSRWPSTAGDNGGFTPKEAYALRFAN